MPTAIHPPATAIALSYFIVPTPFNTANVADIANNNSLILVAAPIIVCQSISDI